eukprot:337417-Pyramimonas_sp.AAC.1
MERHTTPRMSTTTARFLVVGIGALELLAADVAEPLLLRRRTCVRSTSTTKTTRTSSSRSTSSLTSPTTSSRASTPPRPSPPGAGHRLRGDGGHGHQLVPVAHAHTCQLIQMPTL